MFKHHLDHGETLEVPPLPPVSERQRGLERRETLARFRPQLTNRLRPGERVISGRVLYSAAWLGEPQDARASRSRAGRRS